MIWLLLISSLIAQEEVLIQEAQKTSSNLAAIIEKTQENKKNAEKQNKAVIEELRQLGTTCKGYPSELPVCPIIAYNMYPSNLKASIDNLNACGTKIYAGTYLDQATMDHIGKHAKRCPKAIDEFSYVFKQTIKRCNNLCTQRVETDSMIQDYIKLLGDLGVSGLNIAKAYAEKELETPKNESKDMSCLEVCNYEKDCVCTQCKDSQLVDCSSEDEEKQEYKPYEVKRNNNLYEESKSGDTGRENEKSKENSISPSVAKIHQSAKAMMSSLNSPTISNSKKKKKDANKSYQVKPLGMVSSGFVKDDFKGYGGSIQSKVVKGIKKIAKKKERVVIPIEEEIKKPIEEKILVYVPQDILGVGIPKKKLKKKLKMLKELSSQHKNSWYYLLLLTPLAFLIRRH